MQGFERLVTNSLEQLFINFAAERLHHLSLHDCLTRHLASSRNEGIELDPPLLHLPSSVVLQCSSACVDLIGQRLLPLLDSLSESESPSAPPGDGTEATIPGGCDESDSRFCERLHAAEVHCPLLTKPGRDASNLRGERPSVGFVIAHHASRVLYSAVNFTRRLTHRPPPT